MAPATPCLSPNVLQTSKSTSSAKLSRYEKTDPERFDAFIKIINQFGQRFVSANPTGDPNLTEQMNQDVRSQIATLFADGPDLITKVDESIKQQKLKASEKYTSEFSFDEHVKLRFADQPNKLAEFNGLFLNAGKQMLEDPSPQRLPQIWKEMYSSMAAVLDGEPDLMEEFEVFYARMKLGIQA